MKNYDNEIEELELKLKVMKDEKKNFDLMMPNIKLAEMIHKKTCFSNHTDGCYWYYEKWDGFNKNSTRNNYLKKANEILSKVSYKDAIHVIENL